MNNNIKKIKEKSKDKLIQLKTFWPFTLFRDEVIVDKNKVKLVYRHFLFSKTVFPILIKDIKTITVTTGPFFATIEFEIEGYEQNPKPIGYLIKKQALETRKIITGMVVAVKEENKDDKNKNSSTILEKTDKKDFKEIGK